MKSLLIGLVFSCLFVSCGGSGSPASPATPNVKTLTGPWEFQVQSSVYQGGGAPTMNLVETNLKQSGSSVSANGNQQIDLVSVYPTFYGLGFGCTGSATAQLSATLSGDSLDFNLSLSDGSAVHGTATVGADGNITGTYSGGCPADDHGTLSGRKTVQAGGTYAGQLLNSLGGTDSVSATLVESSDSSLAVTGLDDGVSFSLSGFVVGAGIESSGTISGQSVLFIGYLPGDGTLQVWDGNSGTFLGALQKQ